MKDKEKELSGYGILYTELLDTLDESIDDPLERMKVLNNFANLIKREHGYEAPEDMELTPIGKAMFTMFAKRFERNVKNWSKCKKGGAPKGNKNAERPEAKKRRSAVKKGIEAGLTYQQIADKYDIPVGTVGSYAKKLKQQDEADQPTQDDVRARDDLLTSVALGVYRN